MTPAEVSAGLRRQAFGLPPFDPQSPADRPYGFITEFRQGEAIVTLTAFASGDASLYLSTGGGIIGGIGKPGSPNSRATASMRLARSSLSSNSRTQRTRRSRANIASMS